MTFLQLCQRLRQEVGAAGNGPANVAGQSGEYARLVSWIQQAWHELQNHRRWTFDWAQGAVELNPLDAEYSLPEDFDLWEPDTLRFQGSPVRVVTWAELQDIGGGAFSAVAMAPDGTLHLSQPPNATGNLTFEYWRTPQPLATNTDTPRMPERFHMAIVYRAMLQYGLYENAPEVVQQANANLRILETQLAESQLPTLNQAPSLA